ncbi:MAG TPA: histidine kinase, partial [Chthoniobacteraceae bacterium]
MPSLRAETSPWRTPLILALAACLLATNSAKPAETPALTTIRQVNELSAEEAAHEYPVHLRAVVTGVNVSPACFLSDGTGAIYFGRPGAKDDLVPGQIVEVDAVTQPGLFSSTLSERKTVVVGNGALPEPEQLTLDQLALGAADCHYVEIEGVVHRAESIESFRCLDLQLATHGGLLRVYLFHAPGADARQFVDAKVRMRGVVSSRFNQKRQWVAARLNVDGMDNVVFEEPARKEPFTIPAKPARSLAKFEAQPSGFAHRIKVRGVVLFQDAGAALYIRDGDQPLLLKTSERLPLARGDVIEALGFLAMGAFSPYLEDVSYRKTAEGSVSTPTPVSPKGLLTEDHDADLVSTEAELLDTVRRGDEQTFVLQAGDIVFNARFLRREGQVFPPDVRRGSLLRLTGICSIQETEERSSNVRPKSFRLELPSPEGVVVLRAPSWWTPARLLWALAGAVLLVALGAAWIWQLRRRVREQTGIILQKAQREAVLEERSRIARDFHDTLEQELAGLSMQLDAVGRKFDQSPPSARTSLELARRMLMHCRGEAKRSVWDLRCIALEQGDLVSALQEI